MPPARRLLVSGGAGFIGSAFVRRALDRDRDLHVVVLDKLTYAGNRANLHEVDLDPSRCGRLRFVVGDIADADVVSALAAEVDAIVNFAAETHVDRSILDPSAFMRTNVSGVHVLLDACRSEQERARRGERGEMRLLQVSTDEVYGSVESGESHESDPLSPRSPYAAAKAAGELLALSYHITYGLDVVITRAANTYGPYQHPEKLIPLFVTNAIDDKALPLYGDGLQRRDWLYVDDHADAIVHVLAHGTPGAVYNIPGGQERTNRDVVASLLGQLAKPWSLVRSVADRPGHDRRYAMSGERISDLGWRPQVDFDAGLARTVDWFRTNESWWRTVRSQDWDAYYSRQYADRLAASTPAD